LELLQSFTACNMALSLFKKGGIIMRRQSNPWVLLIGAAIMGTMLLFSFTGNISVKTAQLKVHNKVMAVSMKTEFHTVEVK
jgi:hypothetical protein